MVVRDDLKKVIFEYVGLSRRHAVDASMVNLASSAKETLPPSHRIRSFNWITSSEVQSDVLRRSAFTIDQLKRISGGCSTELWGVVGSCEALGQILESRRQTILGFIPTSPERIATCVLGQLDNLEDRVVRRYGLKGYV